MANEVVMTIMGSGPDEWFDDHKILYLISKSYTVGGACADENGEYNYVYIRQTDGKQFRDVSSKELNPYMMELRAI